MNVEYKQVFVVQSLRRGLFLKPGREPGDVDYTELIAAAGYFFDEASAIDTAAEYLDPHDFLLFSFYLRTDDIRLRRARE